MITILKNLFSLVLPITVLVLVPMWVENEISLKNPISLLAGSLIMAPGLIVFFSSVFLFIRKGKGTLAPWNPPVKLVVSGFYRYVRNPMIMAVLIILTGEAIIFLSIEIFLWAILFFFINSLYFSLSEEPGLEKRFGEAYLDYKKNVRMWIPKLKPYQPL
ncbi:MAG: isoprenylcysteine carboxylmethyltransferase family protein [Bacteroidales bacterium]